MKKFFQNLNILGIIMLGLCVLLGVGDVAGAMFADGSAVTLTGAGKGLSHENGNVETNEGVGKVVHQTLETSDMRDATIPGRDFIDDPVDQKLVQIRPYANPLDTILRYAGVDNINNLEFGWYSIGTRRLEATVGTGGATNTAGTAETAKGKLPVADNKIDLFDVTDTVCVEGVAGADGEDLQLYIYKKDDDYLYFTVSVEQMTESSGTYTIPAIAAGKTIYAMGRAAAEKDTTTTALSVLPEKQTGYCQIFMCQIEETTYAKMADKEVKFDMSEIEENVLFDYRRRLEGTFLRGHKGKVYDPVKKSYIYNTDGILNQITKEFDLYAGNTDKTAEIVDLHKYVFTKNNGAKVRYAICGSDAIANISKMQNVERQQSATETEVVFGITWSKMVSNFGQINMIQHELMDEYGLSDKMIIIDPQFVKMKRVKGFERQQVNGRDHLIVNGDIVIFSEACGVALYNPDVHCLVTVHEGTGTRS